MLNNYALRVEKLRNINNIWLIDYFKQLSANFIYINGKVEGSLVTNGNARILFQQEALSKD